MRTGFRRCQSKTGPATFTKVFAPVIKAQLRDLIIQQLQQELARQTNAAEMARDEAISEESRAENKWDTHSQEAAYLAEGQAKLAAEIHASIAHYRAMALPEFGPGTPIALGALIELESTKAGRRSRYFLGPHAGGLELPDGPGSILVVTPSSPLGRLLLGRKTGDEVAPLGKSSGTQRIVRIV